MRNKLTVSEGLLLALAVIALLIAWSIATTARASNERLPAPYSGVLAREELFHRLRKPLPPGFHHFMQVPAELRDSEVPSEGVVLCSAMETAISFGRRIWLNYTPEAAIRDISTQWRGNVPCGFLSGRKLKPIEYAVRGDERARPITIFKWHDDAGRVHFTAMPKRY